MFEIIEASKKRALISQNWFDGENGWRVGNPYQWVDGEQVNFNLRGVPKVALHSYLSAYYGEFPTPQDFLIPDFDTTKQEIRDTLHQIYSNCFPYKEVDDYDFYLTSMSHVRTQDYSFLKTYCPDLKEGITHIDLGPGVGSHALYSRKMYNSKFYGVEAATTSYMAQQEFLQSLEIGPQYFDCIAAELMGLEKSEVRSQMASDKYKVVHTPSWYFPEVADGCADLVTATWMLNEVSYSGVLWLATHSHRALKKGGYFYVRDSQKKKGHDLDHDEVLKKLGFELVHQANVTNLVDYYGVPRVYKKVDDKTYTYNEAVNLFIPNLLDVNRGKGKESGIGK